MSEKGIDPKERIEQLEQCLREIDDMITSCGGVPRHPDSLPMMVREHARAGLAGGYPES